MIERGVIDNRHATLAYVDGAFNPVDKIDAPMVKVLFDDGDVAFLSLAQQVRDGFDPDEPRDEHGRWAGEFREWATTHAFGASTVNAAALRKHMHENNKLVQVAVEKVKHAQLAVNEYLFSHTYTPTPPDLETALTAAKKNLRQVEKSARSLVHDDYNPDEPRDDHGMWSAGIGNHPMPEKSVMMHVEQDPTAAAAGPGFVEGPVEVLVNPSERTVLGYARDIETSTYDYKGRKGSLASMRTMTDVHGNLLAWNGLRAIHTQVLKAAQSLGMQFPADLRAQLYKKEGQSWDVTNGRLSNAAVMDIMKGQKVAQGASPPVAAPSHFVPSPKPAVFGQKRVAAKDYDPDEERDYHGRWTEGGGQSRTPAQDLLSAHSTGEETEENIQRLLTPEQLRASQAAEAKLREGVPTNKQFIGPDGKYTSERAALHQKILDGMFTPEKIVEATPPDGHAPVLTLTGGRPASGKTTALQNELRDVTKHSFMINADLIQEKLPGYTGELTGLYNGEAQDIALQAEKIARGAGLNITYDATLKSTQPAIERVDTYHAAGYKVNGYFVHTSPTTSAVRSMQRFMEMGRYVPTSVSMHSRTNEKTFDTLIPKFNKWALYDNNGTKPVLVARGGKS